MARSRPPIVRLSDLTPGQAGDFFALLAEKTRGMTRDGKAYYLCRFRDARHSVAFMVWQDGHWFEPCQNDWQAAHFYKLRAIYGVHERYGPQLNELLNIRPVNDADHADGFDPAQFVDRSRRVPSEMFAELLGLVDTQIADEPLRRLTHGLLEAHAPDLQRLPGSRDRCYPFSGGLIEHTLAVTRLCIDLSTRYVAYYDELKPPLNRDLVIAAAALHEIGKVLEFGSEEIAPSLTIPGRLVGHQILGRDLVREAARVQGDVDPERLLLLEHLLLSYLTLPEWGSQRLPLVPECILLHHADDLDAKLEMYVRCLTRDRSAGPFTDREPGLNRALLKDRKV
jgi:3'-5' exoribonuclease